MALREVAKANYPKIMPEVRAGIEAFIAGINDYMDAHRNEVPGWWGTRRVEKHLPVAFGRQYIWGWPSGQAFDDLRATGLRPNFTVDMRASNEMAVAPSRSAEGVPMLIIDPHLGWFGRQRFWSYDFTLARFTREWIRYRGRSLCRPWTLIGCGVGSHNGGPDMADIYTLEPN